MSFWNNVEPDKEAIHKKAIARKAVKISLIVVLVLLTLFGAYKIISFNIPIRYTEHDIGEYKVYYIDSSRFVYCDIDYDYLVYEDDDYEYIYDITGIAHCHSQVFIWEEGHYYSIRAAIEEGFISLDEFLDSDLVVINERA